MLKYFLNLLEISLENKTWVTVYEATVGSNYFVKNTIIKKGMFFGIGQNKEVIIIKSRNKHQCYFTHFRFILEKNI